MWSNDKHIKHLYNRACFGLSIDELAIVQNQPVARAVEQLFKASVVVQPILLIKESTRYSDAAKEDELTRKMFMMQQRQQEKQLNIAWMNQMASSHACLREKMTLFWHNHFACRSKDPFYAQQLNNIHRQHALGNFKTLLLATSKSPAMLQFLNNQQNRKDHPNENFARELMELFTIGRGNYTEQDIKESARAFTGWGFDKDGNFVARQHLHDTGPKTFFGITGDLNGEDIVDLLLQQKQTARFICTKLYRYLVNEVPDKRHIDAMTEVFYNANYEITPVLRYVFTSPWFYDDQNTGNLIKSPVELMVTLNRQFYVVYSDANVLVQFQRALGQVLFYPPNVAGWPGGKSWIDSSSLMYRLKIPSTVLNDGLINFTGKADPEDEAFLASARQKKEDVHGLAQTTPDWDKFLSTAAQTTRAQVAETLLAGQLSPSTQAIINNAADIKTMAIELVSTPEYQLC